jgi:hypothetical protein
MRFTQEANIQLFGDRSVAVQYIGLARKLLGDLTTYNHDLSPITREGITSRTHKTPDGALIQVIWFPWQPVIKIFPPGVRFGGGGQEKQASPCTSLTWAVEHTGQDAGNPFTFRDPCAFEFRFENSTECEGSNINIQTGKLVANLTLTQPLSLQANIVGAVEQQNDYFDILEMYVFADGEPEVLLDEWGDPGNYLVRAQGRNLGKRCVMGPPEFFANGVDPNSADPAENLEALDIFPLALSAGKYKLVFAITSGDEQWHNNAYYSVQLRFV